MLGFGASVFSGGGGGTAIVPSVLAVVPGASGVVGQLGSSIPSATYSRVSGTGFTISASGSISLAAGLAAGASATATIRAANAATQQAIEAVITLLAVTANLSITMPPASLVRPMILGAPKAGVTLVVDLGSWSNDDTIGLVKLINIAAPLVNGSAFVGSTLTTSPGTWQ